VDEDFNDAFDDAGFDVSPAPGPAQVGMASVDEGDALDYTQRTTIPGTNITGFISPQSYMETRGATATNPFPESIFSRIFGAENVDYTGMGIDVAGINNLRYRQAMGLPSLTTGQDYGMGDFYIGQPTMEGTVKEVPGGGIMNMIPGLSTFTNFIGRNRGLPEGSDAFKEAMADSKKPSFQPITDIINSFTRGVGSLKNIFDTEETNTNPMSMPEAAVIREKYDYGDRPLSAVMGQNTFGSMPQNVGIVTMAPENKTEADMAVTDAMSNLATNPIAIIPEVQIDRIPSDIFSSLPTKDDRRERDFIREVLEQRTKSKPTVPVNMDKDGFIILAGGSPDPRNAFLTAQEQLPVAGRVIVPSDNMPFRNLASDDVMADFDIFEELNKDKREEDLYGRTIAENELEI
tara:strand:+ start:239 stop:1450 length:1212 start_codon:yes stop_codon:yes gene_type:complete